MKKAMEIIVALGESLEAAKLILIYSVHMAGSSVVFAGDAGTNL
ncbi:hypothetical protein PY093_10555 [Cytobacillus sp. S13-E01]|nr:hypothetical protein [Cytobacillus sp. S13-E01]MDF0727154.1 hypothetical protein [Cytobacillus sp. S13-E01]